MASLALRSRSTGTVQDDWSLPASPDFTSTLYATKDYTISWDDDLVSSLSEYCPNCDPESVEVYMMGDYVQSLHCKITDPLKHYLPWWANY